MHACTQSMLSGLKCPKVGITVAVRLFMSKFLFQEYQAAFAPSDTDGM